MITSVVRENPPSAQPTSIHLLQPDSLLPRTPFFFLLLLLLLFFFSLLLSAVRSLFCVLLLGLSCSGSVSSARGGATLQRPNCLSDCCRGLWVMDFICSVSEQLLSSRISVQIVRERRPEIVTHCPLHMHTHTHACARACARACWSSTVDPVPHCLHFETFTLFVC